MARVAINGLGRIGRATLKLLLDEPALELVAVNDLAPADNLGYLLRHDSVYGRWPHDVEARDDALVVDGHEIRVLSVEEPDRLPWAELDVDLVFECTGRFRHRDDLDRHLDAGARRVILSAPPKGGEVPTVVPGVNEPEGAPPVVSVASCTTNCIAPIMEILDRRIGVAKATMTTVHAYTSSQAIVDAPASKWRRGRAAAANLVPTTTGAADATTEAVPRLEGRFDGAAVRAPVPVGSIADITAVTRRPTSVDELNEVIAEEAGGDRYRGVLGVSHEPLVSSDIVADDRASVVDLTMTAVTDGDLVKVMSWYDNEWGYAAQMVRHARAMVGEPTRA